MRDLKGATAFITGGASGIGLGMAEAFGANGMKVMIADIEADALGGAVEALRARQIDAAGVVVDVSDRRAMVDAAKQTVSRFGAAHVVCNNAGVAVGGAIGEIPPSDWEWIIDVNLKGVVYGVEAFLPIIEAQGEGGHFVNTSSMSGLVASGKTEPYAATKYAVVGMSEGWAVELASRGIGVSVLCPGVTQSRIYESRRNRAARYGPDADAAMGPMPGVDLAAQVRAGVPARTVGDRVVEAIRANELYILPHPEYERLVRRRFDAILAAFERAAASPLLPASKVPSLPESMTR